MKIDTQSTQQLFLDHLLLEGNDRILFSGKFGTGKSFFLREFFETYNKEYEIIWLSPVDYVVGANGDIFEWIKIDIAKHLVDILDDHKLSNSDNLLVQTYLYRNIGSLCVKLIEILSNKLLHDKTGVEFLDTYKVMLEDYRRFEIEQNESNKSHLQILSERITNETNSRGSIFEDDLISQTIRASIELLKLQCKKDSVLIIDDLDRLDPEHVFRILNILSAHNNHFDSNKFGFSKVIIVCDIDNIKHLFQHKYGLQSDFDGYIEKYFTYEPFNYSIEKAISFYCANNHFIGNLDSYNKQVFSYLLQLFFKHKRLNARKLKKIHYYLNIKPFPVIDYDYNKMVDRINVHIDYSFINSVNISVNYEDFHFLKVLKLLIVAFGSKENLLQSLYELRNEKIDDDIVEPIIFSVALIAHISKYMYSSHSVFFKINDLRDYRSTKEIVKPNISSFHISGVLPLQWSTSRPYQQGNYFTLDYPARLYELYQKNRTALTMQVLTLHEEIKSIISLMDTFE